VLLQSVVTTTILHAQFEYQLYDGGIVITKYLGASRDVNIPNAIDGIPVKYIGAYAFYTNFTVTNVTIPSGVISISNNAFQNASNLASITMPETVAQIGSQAFVDCLSLMDVTIPDGVKSIGAVAFMNCRSLNSVNIGRGVTNLEQAVFSFCPTLTNISVSASNPAFSSLRGVLFDNPQKTLIQYPPGLPGHYAIPNTVTRVSGYSFANSPAITSVTIPGSVTNLEFAVFASCSALTNVALPNGVITIGISAFSRCTKLAGVTIPDSVTKIDIDAFKLCAVSSISIPRGVTYIGYSAFSSCVNLNSITVDPQNTSYSSVDGVLYTKGQTTLLQCPAGKAGHFTIPDGVTVVEIEAFASCSRLTSVMIPDSLNVINLNAFAGCTGLTSLNIPASVTNIWDRAFESCTNLTAAYFQGKAPGLISWNWFGPVMIFQNDPVVTVYYVPGTGWGPTFGGAPTVLWNPQAQSPGFIAGQFGFGITGPANVPIVVEACAELIARLWLPVSTNALNSAGLSSFTDPQSGNHSNRFYRFRSP
jgi:hypothetical protein